MRRVIGFDAAHEERGATMIIVCVLVLTIMVMGALVVDVAAMVQEKRELQNGADAAALAVAHDCALDDKSTACKTASAAQGLADSNALDAASSVSSPVNVNTTNRTVTVKTVTKTKGGSSVLPFSFAKVVGQPGKTLSATATASWTPIGNAATIPLTLSQCEFNSLSSPFNGQRVVIFKTTTSNANGCPSQAAGHDIPGGFGWLDDTACSSTFSTGDVVSADTGVSMPTACKTVFPALIGKNILVPIFNNYSESTAKGGGTKATYTITGFGEFVLEGYRFPGAGTLGTLPSSCKPSDTCIVGHFIRFVENSQPGTGGGNFGAYLIRLVS